MGPRRCAIKGCGSISGRQEHRGVTFHTFPLNPITRLCWIKNCSFPDNKNITKSVLVCSRHFRRADFQPLKNNKYFLKQGAVPTIFPWGTLPYTEPALAALLGAEMSDMFMPPAVDKSPVGSGNIENPSEVKVDVKTPLKRSASADEPSPMERQKKIIRKSLDSAIKNIIKPDSQSAPVSFDPVSLFLPGSRIEAQDFNEIWHFAKVVEVDHDEREVLIHFEKNSKNKNSGIIDEWISMNSSRLRPVQTVKKTGPVYVVGEKCQARWSDSRKFPATVQKILENNTYELLFDDGYVKVVRGSYMSKIKPPEAKGGSTPGRKSQPPLPIPKFDLSELNLKPVPRDGEWCCNWVNDTPIGAEGFLDGPDGHKRPTVLVEDWRLPAGWTKHLYQRSSVSGKWDVVLVGPNKKRFRSKADVKVYLEEKGEIYNPDIYDFSIHKRRSKDIGLFILTDSYKTALQSKQEAELRKNEIVTPTVTPQPNKSDESFPGFSLPTENELPASEVTTPSTPVIIPSPQLEAGYVYVGALKVQIVNNLFRCPDESCNKNFRKENHLQIHVKHYHEEMAKLLGVCPNMTDLAYLRTMGQPIDETIPKNQIPNVQFFEKVYQSELHMKTHRKSMSSPTSNMKLEPKTLTSASEFKKELHSPLITGDLPKTTVESSELNQEDSIQKKILLLSETPNDESSFEKTFLMQECIGYPIQPSTSTPAKKELVTDLMDAEALIQTHSVSRVSIKRGGPGRRKGFAVKAKVPKMQTKQGVEDVEESMETEDTRHSFRGQPETITKTHKLKFLQQPALDSIVENTNSQTTGSNTEHSNSPKYINENGEMIKIVRMRQEEIINCLCSYGEEDGLMIQCELCLCWQHGICNGIEKESQVPEKYVCYICQNPHRARESMKYVHDQDWLYDGKLSVANYQSTNSQRTTNPKHAERFNVLKQSHTLTGNLLELKRFLHSLKVKINIASNKDHPKMYLWSKSWEKSTQRIEVSGIEPLLPYPNNLKRKLKTTDDNKLSNNIDLNNLLDEETKTIEVIKLDINSPICSVSDVKEIDIKKEIDTNVSDTSSNRNNTVSSDIKRSESDGSILAGLLNNIDIPTNSKEKTPERTQIQSHIPQPEAAIDSTECQHKLLDHIQKQQSLAMTRLQTIESQIIALEAMDEKVDTTEPSDNFARTKQTIYMLLNDLTKMRKLATVNRVEANYLV